MTARLVISWAIGGLFILLGVWIINNLKLTLGVSELSYVVAMIVAYILILIGGLLWINIAVAVKTRM